MPRRWLFLLAGLFLHSIPAHAAYSCQDEWGHNYVFRIPPRFSLILFTCQPHVGNPQLRLTLSPPSLDQQGPNPPPAAEHGRQSRFSGALTLIVTEEAGRRRTRRGTPIEPSEELDRLIARVADAHDHDQHLLKAIMYVESRFNPLAVSPKGAIGLMQVMPATGARMGVEEPSKSLFDPKTNLEAGARYITLLKRLFPNRLDLVLAAYNAGEGAVIRHRRSIPPYRETQAYVRSVLENLEYFEGQ